MARVASPAWRAGVLLVLGACSSGPGLSPIRTAFNKGVYHHSRGELDAAVGEYREALEEDPRDLRARFNLAAAYDEQGRAARQRGQPAEAAALLALAEREYRGVLQQEPDHLRAGVNLAALQYERGETAAAKVELRRAIDRYRDLALPRTALAMRLLGEGDLDAAEALLREALGAEPADLSANLLFGDLCARRGRPDEARAAYRTALVREPDDPGALLALARLEIDAGKDAEALALLRQLVLRDAHHLAAQLLLASVHERRGELEDAVLHLWRARDLDQDTPPRTDYLARLRALYARLLAAPPATRPQGQ